MTTIRIFRKAIDSFFTGAIFFVLGCVLQLGNLLSDFDSGYIIAKYWPTLLIFIGLKYVIFSVIHTTRGSYKHSTEVEEELLKLTHGHNPIGGIIWGVGLIFIGLMLIFNWHEESSFWSYILTYWPVLFILAGLNGMVKCFAILISYANITRYEHQ